MNLTDFLSQDVFGEIRQCVADNGRNEPPALEDH